MNRLFERFRRYPFFLLTPLAIFGIFCGTWLISWPWSVFATLCCLIPLLFLPNNRLKQYLLLISLIFIFAIRFHLSERIIASDHYLNYDWKTIHACQGMIDDAIYRINGSNKYILDIRKIFCHDTMHTVSGKLMLYSNRIFKYGDYLQFEKEWRLPDDKKNPGQFDYRKYLNRQDIYALVFLNTGDPVSLLAQAKGNPVYQYIIEPVRGFIRQILERCNSEDISSLLSALILGERQNLDQSTVTNFTLSGVVHVLAISGLHVGFLLIFITIVLQLFRIPYRSRFIILLVFLFLYLALVRFKPSVLRASLMAVLYIYGTIREKKVEPLHILFSAAFLMLLYNPRDLYNPGFQFSYLAVAGILVLFPRLNLIFSHRGIGLQFKVVRYIWYSFLISFAATLFTLPLTIYYYGIWPVYSIPLNVLVIPLVGIVLFLGFMQIVIASLSTTIALGIGQLIAITVKLITGSIQLCIHLPYAALDLPTPPLVLILLSYIFIFLLLTVKNVYRIGIVLGFFTLILCYWFVSRLSDGNADLTVAMLDVGHGDAAIVRFPNGKSLLIDAGDCTPYFDHGLQTVLPYLKVQGDLHLTYVVITHADRDHAGGIVSLIGRVAIDTLIINNAMNMSPLGDRIVKKSHTSGITIRYVSQGQYLYPDAACRVYVLHPYSQGDSDLSDNDRSVVLKIQYGKVGILFTGDIEEEGIKNICNYGAFLESEILKLPHHGGMVSHSPALLQIVNPVIAVASVSENNRFNLPSYKLLQYLKMMQIPVLQTGQEGAVIFNVTPCSIRRIKWR